MLSVTPRPHFTPGKDPVPIVQEAGWAPGPVWTGGKSRENRVLRVIFGPKGEEVTEDYGILYYDLKKYTFYQISWYNTA